MLCLLASQLEVDYLFPMRKMDYKRKGLSNSLRILLRTIDFLFLIMRITQSNQSSLKLRKLVLVELGPGPTRLSFLKNFLFKKVIYVDITDYGVNSPSLVIRDISRGIPLPEELLKFVSSYESLDIIYTADHCLEHLPFDTILKFLKDYEGYFIFRVPNVRSLPGLEDFRRDPTHLTAFDDQQLEKIRSIADINVIFWTRFYTMTPNIFFHRKESNLYDRELCMYEI